MNRPRPSMTPHDQEWATRKASNYVREVLQRAELIRADAKRAARVEANFCLACYYVERIGGAAMTSAPCMTCGKDQMYGSTNTDVLCLDCAREHALCKHCGGDFQMNVGRRSWPTPQA